MSNPINNGVLINGRYEHVPGLNITSPGAGAPSWVKLNVGDYRARPRGADGWVRQVIVHTTKGVWPQTVLPGAGKGDRDKIVADFWNGDPEHSAAQVVFDNDGSIVCLCDLALVAAFHAGLSNNWSIGIEMYQELGGGVHEAVYQSMMIFVPWLCSRFGIAFQIPKGPYLGRPIDRMRNGGPDMVGVFGHRDNTHRRGKGDPGDEIGKRFAALGAEQLDFAANEDITVWTRRQSWLNAHGARLKVDGIAGPGTIAAMRAQGFTRGADIPA